MERADYLELVKEYFDHMPSDWEEYAVKILEDRIIIVGTDKRAAMWGIYHIARLLGVLSASPITESIPKPCFEIAEGEFWDKPKSYKLRGWFLNEIYLRCHRSRIIHNLIAN